MNSALRITFLFLLSMFSLSSGSATPPNGPQSDQSAQVIEVTAKKYEYSPSPIRVKVGAPVQLKFTSLDKTHGFKINSVPRRGGRQRRAGACFQFERRLLQAREGNAHGSAVYSAHRRNVFIPLLQPLRTRSRRNERSAGRRTVEHEDLLTCPILTFIVSR